MDFKVKCVNVKWFPEYFTVGKIYSVRDNKVICDNGWIGESWSLPMNGNADFEAFSKWFSAWYDFELVEDKKVFTKSDPKNGDVIVRRNGLVEIVMLDLGVLITNGTYNDLNDIKDDLTDVDSNCFNDDYDIVKVYRPTEKCHCSFNPYSYVKGELVYDRERDTKHKYNGKVVCIDLDGYNEDNYTVGKIYEFKNGCMTADSGHVFGKHFGENFYTFKDWENFSNSKFIEIKE